MKNIDSIATDLFDKIRSRFEAVNIGDKEAQTCQEPEKARFFNFDYVSKNGDKFGNVTVSIANDRDLKIYFSKNITEKLNDAQKEEWYSFLRNLRMFSKRHMMNFDTRDISRDNLEVKDVKQISHADSTFDKDDVNESTESKEFTTLMNSIVKEDTSLTEIGFADELGNLTKSDEEILSAAKKDGMISQRPVMLYVDGDTQLYFFADGNKISSLILLVGNNLKAIKNFTSEKGLIFALLNYVVNIKNIKLHIVPGEPLTSEGFKWISKLIASPFGLKITDIKGNPIDLNLLRKEWEKSKSTQGTWSGETGIVIGESSLAWKNKLQENENRLMPFIYFNVNESKLYGKGRDRTRSYQDIVGEAKKVRLVVKHNTQVDEEQRGSRSRHIAEVFVETEDGERFKLPFNNLTGARAMGTHIAYGGQTHDHVGMHIAHLVNKMNAMRKFVRAASNKTFEGNDAAAMVESAIAEYGDTKDELHRLKGSRGYAKFISEFKPETENEEDDTINLNELKDKFSRKVFDNRLEEALPHVFKAHAKRTAGALAAAATIAGCTVAPDGTTQTCAPYVDSKNGMAGRYGHPADKKPVCVPTAKPVNEFIDEADETSWTANSAKFNPDDGEDWGKDWRERNAPKEQTHAEREAIWKAKKAYWDRNKEVKEADEFEQHMDQFDSNFDANPRDLSELKDLLSTELTVGPEGINVLPLINQYLTDEDTSELEDAIYALSEVNPDADATPVIKDWIRINQPSLIGQLGLEKGEKQSVRTQAPQPEMQAPQQNQKEPNYESYDPLSEIKQLSGLK